MLEQLEEDNDCNPFDEKYHHNIKDDVFELVVKFMNKYQITCSETVYQTDKVIENAYGFIDELRELVDEFIEKAED